MSHISRKKDVKKTDTEENRRRHRQEAAVSIRKEKRNEGLQKRRNLAAEATIVADPASIAGSASASLAGEPNVSQLDAYCSGEFSRLAPFHIVGA